jgi:hypothetical protein
MEIIKQYGTGIVFFLLEEKTCNTIGCSWKFDPTLTLISTVGMYFPWII